MSQSERHRLRLLLRGHHAARRGRRSARLRRAASAPPTSSAGAELDRFKALAGAATPLTVGCTQEAPLFTEVAEEIGAGGRVAFANIRETAGWSDEAAARRPEDGGAARRRGRADAARCRSSR